MAVKIASSLSCVCTSFSSPFHSTTTPHPQVSLPPRLHDCKRLKIGVDTRCSFHQRSYTNLRFQKTRFILFASVNELISGSRIEPDDGTDEEDDDDDFLIEDEASTRLEKPVEKSGGRPGLISFYNHRPYEKEPEILNLVSTISTPKQTNLLWFVGPALLVASFIFPSLYMRKILSTVFEDSLLTDFLILFFTEALFYCGVAVFLSIVDHVRRPSEPVTAKSTIPAPQLVYRITSVAALVLSLVIPLVTMGLVWPWTGPAASATLAPYLVGIVVQFAFEQYARYVKSPSWPVIPVIFQVYRLHQLNRAAQLVTALSYTVRGAESTPHNLAINSSLGTLLNVLQCLGVVCIWSLSSFLMRFLPSAIITDQ